MEYMSAAHPADLAATETPQAPPPIVSPTTHMEGNGDERWTEEEDDDDEDRRAPVELIIKFLRALTDRDFPLAKKLCQMILIYEPENPEASEFLPLIQRKLLEEQEIEQSSNKDDDGDEDEEDDDSGSDEKSSQSSSSSSSQSDDDDEEEGKQLSRHKLCPSGISL